MRIVKTAALAALVLFFTSLMPGMSHAADGTSYVAMGDSFASGAGAGSYYPDTASKKGDGCYRSQNAYGPLLGTELGADLDFRACSGARIPDIYADQVDALDDSTGLVTLSVGGNDIGFADVLSTCTFNGTSTCEARVDEAERQATEDLPSELDALYAEVRQSAPNADVLIVGYPVLFVEQTCWGNLGINTTEQKFINDATYVLRDVVAAAAGRAGFSFADPIDEFDGRGVCASGSYVNGLKSDLAESYHPNATGHADGFMPELRSAVAAVAAS
ncbi:SGNH/GDSL hydrolase family protein [Salininema proteolyticum]|uniref:SGNH/GDSL hydrolase family protein n=1 Tax=Salininema proteolyticum TaxID=1607685 RepID=A0ABV8TYU7_9ACTN